MNMFIQLLSLLCVLAASSPSQAIYHMYLTGQHNLVPSAPSSAYINHVALAFMRSDVFNTINQTEWPLFTTVEAARSKFAPGTKVMVAIGGWGDTGGFEKAAGSEEGREVFAANVKAMIEATGADGIDIDWEYPGGNGEDYKTTPNSEKVWEIDAYVQLLTSIRKTIGSEKLIPAAVPGIPRDMIAFTKNTVPEIAKQVDFLNIMTYDLMNRRDSVTKHHAGIEESMTAIEAYLENGLPPSKANLGFAFYVKWFKTDSDGGCDSNPIGCRTALLEDPTTGADLGKTGGFSWHDEVPSDVKASFERALENGEYDNRSGGHYFWDAVEDRFWTWETPYAIGKKFDAIVGEKGLGGVFAWGLGEDAPDWKHFEALSLSVKTHSESDGHAVKDEL